MQFGEFARHMADNITTDFDRHSVPIVSIRFLDLQFELVATLTGTRRYICTHE